MFSIDTDDECFHVGIERENVNSKKSVKSHIAPYQCCPSTREKAQAKISVLSDAKLGSSKAVDNYQMFKFEHDEPKSAGKPKGNKVKASPKASQEDRKPKKEAAEKPEKKKRERDAPVKEPKDKDIDKKDKKGKEKKEKGKNTQGGDDGDGYFQLGNWW